MENQKPLMDEDGEVRELTAEDLKKFRPFSALPEDEKEMLLNLKNAVIIPDGQKPQVPVEADVYEQYRKTGEGWQKRMDDALRAGLKHLDKKSA